MSDYRVNLEIFAGPLDLLLYLVRKDEVDIYDIPIASITEQYIAYIDMLKSMDIDVAGDFLVMAATLMEVKSAMLLPREDPENEEAAQSDDPRSELIRQLLEYKKFKDAANLLDDSAIQQSQRYSRPSSVIDKLRPNSEPEVDLEQVSIWDLLEAFDSIMKATGRGAAYKHITDDTPIDLYQIEILNRIQSEGPMSFKRIFEGRTNRLVLLGLFMGLLELVREKLVWAEQEHSLGDIYIKALTQEPAETAVRRAMLATEAERAEAEARAMAIMGQKPAPDDDNDTTAEDISEEKNPLDGDEEEMSELDEADADDIQDLDENTGN